MAFDWNKVKQQLTDKNLFARKQQEVPVVPTADVRQPAVPANEKAATGFTASIKQGLADIRRVLEEGNYKLFVKQFVVLLLVIWGVSTFNEKLEKQKKNYIDQMAAISVQETHKQDYLDNKSRLLRLEPAFPDLSAKNEWLLRKIMDSLESHNIQANISGNITENATDNYTVVAQPVSFQLGFQELGKFVADIENADDFLRFSEVNITKGTDSASLGMNNITLRFNTFFPKEKYGPRLFKDYAKQMQELKAAQASKPDSTAKNQPKSAAATSTTGGTNAK